MTQPFRLIDTGVRDGRRQIAFDAALIELHKAGRIPDTIRFLRFPPTVLIGRHQALHHEAHLGTCRAHGIGLVRRITGGGAIYLDPGQVGWELVLSRRRMPAPSLADTARAICEAVALGLAHAFRIDARFRPRNDIEVDGRKLCGTGGFFDGDTLIYQGTVLVDVDPARIATCLNVPAAKLARRDLDRPEARITTLKGLLGTAPTVEAVHGAILDGLARGLGFEHRPGEITGTEETLAATLHDEEIGTEAFVHEIGDPSSGEGVATGSVAGPGGTVTAYLRLEGRGPARRIREALLTGDFFVTPPRVVYDLEAHLRGVAAGEAGEAVARFFDAANPDLLSISPADFCSAIEAALASEQPGPSESFADA